MASGLPNHPEYRLFDSSLVDGDHIVRGPVHHWTRRSFGTTAPVCDQFSSTLPEEKDTSARAAKNTRSPPAEPRRAASTRSPLRGRSRRSSRSSVTSSLVSPLRPTSALSSASSSAASTSSPSTSTTTIAWRRLSPKLATCRPPSAASLDAAAGFFSNTPRGSTSSD